MFGRENLTKYYLANDKIYFSLIDAISIVDNDKIAFIGGGGKTTTIKTLAHDFNYRKCGCIIMTTTKMNNEKLSYDIVEIREKLKLSKTIYIGKKINVDRITKITAPDDYLFNYAISQRVYPVLIEADGSKQKPIKIQRSYEPVIPQFVQRVILVVGIDALYGEIVDVFARPNDYKTSNTFLGIEEMAEIITSEDGLFKDLDDKEVYILINKVDTERKLEDAKLLRKKIKKKRELTVIIANQI